MKNGTKSNLALLSFASFNKAILEEINNIRKNPQIYFEKLNNWGNYIQDNNIKIPGKIEIEIQSLESFNEALNFFEDKESLTSLQQHRSIVESSLFYNSSLDEIESLEKVNGNNAEQLLKLIKMFANPKGLIGEVIQIGYADPELLVLMLVLNKNNRNVIFHEKFRFIGINSKYNEKIDDLICVIHFSENLEEIPRIDELTIEDSTHAVNAPMESKQIIQPFNDFDQNLFENNNVIDYRITKRIINTKEGDRILITKFVKFMDGSSDEWQFKRNLI